MKLFQEPAGTLHTKSMASATLLAMVPQFSELKTIVRSKKETKQPPAMARNPVAIVTGGTTGIGLKACQQLAQQGVDVIFTSRSHAKGETAVQEISKACQGAVRVEYIIMELSSLQSVMDACGKLKGRNIDYLLLNAGVTGSGDKVMQQTDDGIEWTVGVNHVAGVLMALEIIPIMQATEKLENIKTPMITFVSSDLHNIHSPTGAAKKVGPMVEDAAVRFMVETNDLDGKAMFALPGNHERRITFDPTFSYKYSKLLNVMAMSALDKRLQNTQGGLNVTCNTMEPGFIPASDLSRKAKELMGPWLSRIVVWNLYHGPVHWLVCYLIGQPVRTLAEGAASEVFALREGRAGQYYRLDEEDEPTPLIRDEALVDRIWELTLELIASNVKGFDSTNWK